MALFSRRRITASTASATMSGCTRLCGAAVWRAAGSPEPGFSWRRTWHTRTPVSRSSPKRPSQNEARPASTTPPSAEPGPKTGRVIASTRPRRPISPGTPRSAHGGERRGEAGKHRERDVVRVRGLEGVLHRVVPGEDDGADRALAGDDFLDFGAHGGRVGGIHRDLREVAVGKALGGELVGEAVDAGAEADEPAGDALGGFGAGAEEKDDIHQDMGGKRGGSGGRGTGSAACRWETHTRVGRASGF